MSKQTQSSLFHLPLAGQFKFGRAVLSWPIHSGYDIIRILVAALLPTGFPKAGRPFWQRMLVIVLSLANTLYTIRADENSAGNTDDRARSSEHSSQQPLEMELPKLSDNRVSGPYFGINSLFICLSSLGIETNLEKFISIDYVGSFAGSSAKELIHAAEDFGAKAECFSHLTHHELNRVNSPMILHMRGDWAESGYKHWVAFLGYDGDRVRIIDAPHTLQLISDAELLANWDGTAIAIAKDDVNQSFISAARIDYCFAVGLILLTIYVVNNIFVATKVNNKLEPPFTRVRHLAKQMGAIIGFALLFAIGWHTFSEIGFLRNPIVFYAPRNIQ
jgi:hypothetical protein